MEVRTTLILMSIVLLVALSACQWNDWLSLGRLTPTLTSTSTPTLSATTPGTPGCTFSETPLPGMTYLPMCTPPLCAIGTSEAYFCASSCPNGCGTTCATYTPSPTP